MKASVHAQLEVVASKAASQWAKRVFWADRDDLKQEAMIAALESAKTFDPTTGVPLDAYAHRAAMFRLRRYCWRNSSPVSETDHHLGDLRGVHRAELGYDHVADGDAPDDLLAEKQLVEAIRSQVDHVLGAQGDEARVALRVLFDDEPAAKVADEFHLPVVRVYRIVRRARVLLGENFQLFDYWRST